MSRRSSVTPGSGIRVGRTMPWAATPADTRRRAMSVFRPGGSTADVAATGRLRPQSCENAPSPHATSRRAVYVWAPGPSALERRAESRGRETALDLDRDEPVSNIMVAAVDGAAEPRHFTDGPRDSSPRWYPRASTWPTFPPPQARRLHLAPLDGGAPCKVEAPGVATGLNRQTGDQLVIVGDLASKPGAP